MVLISRQGKKSTHFLLQIGEFYEEKVPADYKPGDQASQPLQSLCQESRTQTNEISEIYAQF